MATPDSSRTPTRTVGPGPQNLNATTPPPHIDVEKPFTVEELHSLADDLGHGEIGWLELDDEGTPKGAAKKDPPDPKVPHTKVVGHNPVRDEIVTPSGAPVTKHMNPDPELWDAGMLERNPHLGVRQRQGTGAGQLVAGGNMPADTAQGVTPPASQKKEEPKK